jgi:hypothetical protein
MTQQHPIAVPKNGRNNPDRTGVVSGDRHRHILTHAEAFGLIDAVIRQLSGNAVPYPAAPKPVVHAAAVQP